MVGDSSLEARFVVYALHIYVPQRQIPKRSQKQKSFHDPGTNNQQTHTLSVALDITWGPLISNLLDFGTQEKKAKEQISGNIRGGLKVANGTL